MSGWVKNGGHGHGAALTLKAPWRRPVWSHAWRKKTN